MSTSEINGQSEDQVKISKQLQPNVEQTLEEMERQQEAWEQWLKGKEGHVLPAIEQFVAEWVETIGLAGGAFTVSRGSMAEYFTIAFKCHLDADKQIYAALEALLPSVLGSFNVSLPGDDIEIKSSEMRASKVKGYGSFYQSRFGIFPLRREGERA